MPNVSVDKQRRALLRKDSALAGLWSRPKGVSESWLRDMAFSSRMLLWYDMAGKIRELTWDAGSILYGALNGE
jgi:hypothetical protein